MWYSVYCIQNFDSYHFSDMTLLPVNSSYSFYRMELKRYGQLGYVVVQCTLFRGYSTSNFYRLSISLDIVKI